MRSTHAESLDGSDAGARLLDLVLGLGADFLHERSFRICDAGLLRNRFLTSLAKPAIPGARHRKLLDLWAQMAMPSDMLEAAERNLPGAAFIHFGFEENERGCLYKVYLETGSGAAEPGMPFLLHLAFKWAVGDPTYRAVTRYRWYPELPISAIAERLSDLLTGSEAPENLAVARGLLDLAASRVDARGIQYLEVREDGNARRSFDLNVYDADLRMDEVRPLLARACRRHRIAEHDFAALADAIAKQRFGHLAGGTHREGQDFFNVYYGMERSRG